MAELSREDRAIAAEEIRHSWKMEGFETSPQARALHDRWVAGELTGHELLEEIKRLVKIT